MTSVEEAKIPIAEALIENSEQGETSRPKTNNTEIIMETTNRSSVDYPSTAEDGIRDTHTDEPPNNKIIIEEGNENDTQSLGKSNNDNYDFQYPHFNKRKMYSAHDIHERGSVGTSGSRVMLPSKKNLKKPPQRALPLKVQHLNEQVDVSQAKKRRLVRHLKNRKKEKIPVHRRASAEFVENETKILDGFLLLHSCRVKYPYEAIKSKLSNENIVEVEEGDLLFFQNLISLDLSENRVRMEQLINLKSLQVLNLMYNNINNIILDDHAFPALEILNLAFNNIPPTQIPALGKLTNLKTLDISGNELCTLPMSLSFFGKLEELNLSSNYFSSESVVVEPSKIFQALASIPNLKKLNVSRNMLKAFHYDGLEENAFNQLREIDFSYNRVFDENNLLYCESMTNLQLLNITGNPFSTKGNYHHLEQVLYSTISAIIINHPVSPPNYLKRNMFPKREKLPYPKPVALILQDSSKGVKKQMYDAELNKGIALPLNDMAPNQEAEDEIFPKAVAGPSHNDIFTPPEKINKRFKQEQNNKFFITENEPKDEILEEMVEESQQKPLLAIKDKPHLEESPQRSQSDNEAEFGKNQMERFRKLCRQYLGDVKEYQTPLPISVACKALKHAVKFPGTYVSKDLKIHYMKPTFASKTMQTRKYSERTDEYKKMDQHKKIGKPPTSVFHPLDGPLPAIIQKQPKLFGQKDHIDKTIERILDTYSSSNSDQEEDDDGHIQEEEGRMDKIRKITQKLNAADVYDLKEQEIDAILEKMNQEIERSSLKKLQKGNDLDISQGSKYQEEVSINTNID